MNTFQLSLASNFECVGHRDKQICKPKQWTFSEEMQFLFVWQNCVAEGLYISRFALNVSFQASTRELLKVSVTSCLIYLLY